MTEHVQILKNRTDIAQTINGRNMTVVRLDIADVDSYGLKSEPVVIDNGKFPAKYGWPEMPDMIHSRIRVFTDEKKFTFTSGCVCLSDSFGYSDVEEMLTYRNAPVVKADSDVCLVVLNSRTRTAYAPLILHTTKHIDRFCSTPLGFVVDKPMCIPFYLELGRKELEEAGKEYLRDPNED